MAIVKVLLESFLYKKRRGNLVRRKKTQSNPTLFTNNVSTTFQSSLYKCLAVWLLFCASLLLQRCTGNIQTVKHGLHCIADFPIQVTTKYLYQKYELPAFHLAGVPVLSFFKSKFVIRNIFKKLNLFSNVQQKQVHICLYSWSLLSLNGFGASKLQWQVAYMLLLTDIKMM